MINLPNAKTTNIKEQIIDDLVTGLMLVFSVTPSGESRLHLVGDILPFGNRDFQFDCNGELAGTGTRTCSCQGHRQELKEE
uniref:Uncharacterized protein n=1 Tax=viral metagenome TaxID=1070528 RepID=A0A6M3LPF2_9ZZZZ